MMGAILLIVWMIENGLKIHIGKSHKKVDSTPATPDCLRQQTNSSVSLSASPLLDTSREESQAISPVSEVKSKKPAPTDNEDLFSGTAGTIYSQ